MNDTYFKPTIVVDLDETLVHTTPIAPTDLNNGKYFIITVKKMKFYVQTRPNLQYFLEKTSKLFNICVFTASKKYYASKIISKIFPNIKNCQCFYRDSCISTYGYLIKDLDVINSPLKKILLIDDSAGSALKHPKNLVKIKPWNGEKDDTALKNLVTILEKIAFDDDLPVSFIETLKNGNYEGIEAF